MRKIIDEFTNLPVSVSRKYQLRRQALGLCEEGGCGNLAEDGRRRCVWCQRISSAEARKRYRKAHGIPLDAPPYTRRAPKMVKLLEKTKAK